MDADTAAVGVDANTEAVTGAVVTSSGTLLSLEGTLLPDFFFLGASLLFFLLLGAFQIDLSQTNSEILCHC